MPATPSDSSPSDARIDRLLAWLGRQNAAWRIDASSLVPASSDASFRRYFRVTTGSSTRPSLIIMDAPPAQEDSHAFVAVARLLAGAKVSVPEILSADLDQGFLLLSDLGSVTYLSALASESADALYRDAWQALLRIQQLPGQESIPLYDRALLERELQLFPDWYLERHRSCILSPADKEVLGTAFKILTDAALGQPRVVVHRDFHSRNLMRLSSTDTRSNPGILDFQDAVSGPLTYDLVSLLRDAYIVWEEERILDWTIRYWEVARKVHLPVQHDFGAFWRDFEWMGLQRHLKILGIFARLSHRDGKHNYLANLPAVLQYVRATASRYREFFGLMRLLDRLESAAPTVGYTF